MKWQFAAILLLLMLAMAVLNGAFAKDQSRVPMKGDPPLITYTVKVCHQSTELKQRKRKTIAILHQWDCQYLPSWLQPKLHVSWSNVFRELQRARECGVRVFSNQKCRG